MGNKGFAFIELVVSVAILGVLASYSMVLSSDIGNVYLDAASRRLQSDLAYARQLAISANSGNVYVIFDPGTSRYNIYSSFPTESHVTDPVTHQPLSVDLATYGNLIVDYPYLNITYLPDGTMASGEDRWLRLVSPNGTVSLCLIRKTGSVSIDPYNC